MKKIAILMTSHCLIAGLFAQSGNADRGKIKATVITIVLIALLTDLYQSLKPALRSPVKNLRSE